VQTRRYERSCGKISYIWRAVDEWAIAHFLLDNAPAKATVNQFLPDHIRGIIDEVCTECRVVAVDVRLRGQLAQLKLEIDIDAVDGVSHEECSAVSRGLDERLVEDPWWRSVRSLDVSSPGADTPVRHLWQLVKSIGRIVHVKVADGTVVEGKLAAATDTMLTVSTTTGKGKTRVETTIEIPAESVGEAHVVLQL